MYTRQEEEKRAPWGTESLLPINSGVQRIEDPVVKAIGIESIETARRNTPDMGGGTGLTPQSLQSPSFAGANYALGGGEQALDASDPKVMQAQYQAIAPTGLSTPKVGIQNAGYDKAREQPKKEGSTAWGESLNNASKVAAAAIARYGAAKSQGAVNEYYSDTADWQNQGRYWFDPNAVLQPDLEKYMEQIQGRYWFDPNAVLQPDLEKYMEQMPGATDALRDGMMIEADGSAGSNVGGAFLNPLAIEGVGTTLDNWLGQEAGFSGYVGDKAMQGAMTSGWVGALVGVVEGIFTWGSAQDQDKKAKAKALAEYERKLKEWEINREQRIRSSRVASEQAFAARKAAFADQKKGEKQRQDTEKIMAVAERRKQIISALQNAGTMTDAYRQKRSARWQA